MATRDIRPSTVHTACDVCGRNLLRGERAEAYVHGGARRWVCELCKPRALQEGWVREGTGPPVDSSGAGSERRRSLLSRLRDRRERLPPDPMDAPPPGANGTPAAEPEPEAPAPAPFPAQAQPAPVPADSGSALERAREVLRERRPELRPPRRERARDPRRERGREAKSERVREPRHVRAVPSSPEHRTLAAMELFNGSDHPRTVAGVARSLGLPGVAVLPSPDHPPMVTIVVAWELCWYRYEVDLSEEVAAVRLADQGFELHELALEEREGNAHADDQGMLGPGLQPPA